MRFGTDGVRGVANRDLTPEVAMAIGRAAALHLGGREMLIGRDTRRSGSMLEAAVAAGAASCGVDVILLGVLPTPGVAHLAREAGTPAAMISASHNPFADNGIKLFASGGTKLDDDLQDRVEHTVAALLAGGSTGDAPQGSAVGTVRHEPERVARYVAHLVEVLDGRDLGGLRVALDCANGAAGAVAGDVFRALGAEVEVVFAEPDGVNINDGCGSTHPGALAELVAGGAFDVGFALDGDADRVMAVDASGRLIDGDELMAISALDMAERGILAHDTVVVTVMTNLGFRTAMADAGITVVETPVGDRHVLAELDRGGFNLGGEQSGHLIFRDHATTGDGVLAALFVADLVVRRGEPLGGLASGAMTRLPQVLRNVTVERPMADVADRLADTLAAEDRGLGGRGRILVRPSGTEPVVRVMVEAVDESTAADVASRLCEAINTLR